MVRAAGVTRYHLELAEDSDFASLLLTQDLSATILSMPVLADGTYYWRVQPVPLDGFRRRVQRCERDHGEVRRRHGQSGREDKDDRGCLDGIEDENGNGKRDGEEIDPFDPKDDDCLTGTCVKWNEDNRDLDRWDAYTISISGRTRNKTHKVLGSVSSNWERCNERHWSWEYGLSMDDKKVSLVPVVDYHRLCFWDEYYGCVCGWTEETIPCSGNWKPDGTFSYKKVITYSFADGYKIWSHYEWQIEKPKQ